MAAETQYTANTGMATISTANAELDGTGTIGTVLTAASNGTKVKSVTIKAQTNVTQGMVRLFVTGGGNTRLLAEIEIPAVTKSATDEAFERYLELDLDLQSGYVLKASTQNAETFNVIAEGLDWAYNSTQVRPESTNYTANTGLGIITTANTNLDGTGTVVTILTAGTTANGYKGCLINSIVIKAIVNTGTSIDGMVRLFIQDTGSTTKLLTEVPVSIVTKSGTARSFVHQIDFSGGFNLQAGYKIIASTELSNSFIITVEGNDWKYPANGGSGLLAKNFTPASGTTTTSNELLHSYQITAGLVAVGDILEVYANTLSTENANLKTYRIYFNTSNSLSGATLVATQSSSSTETDIIQRFFPIISDTAVECYGGTTTATRSSYSTNDGTTANATVPSISAGFWIIISGQKATAGDTDTVRWSMIRNNRLI